MSQNRARNCGNQPTTVIRKIRRCSATCSTHSEKRCHCKHTQEKAEKAPDRIQQRHRARKLIRHFQQCAPGLLPPLRSLDFCCPFFVCLHHWSWSFNPLLRFLDISSFRQLPAAALLTKQTRKSCIVHVFFFFFFFQRSKMSSMPFGVVHSCTNDQKSSSPHACWPSATRYAHAL